jgi:hypothetical protein
MAKKAAANVSEDAIIWKEFTSAKGKTFEVGYLSEAEASGRGEPGGQAGKEDFGIACNWPVGPDTWITNSSEFLATTGISRYKLHSNTAMAGNGDVGGYAYRLEFSNEQTYNYLFFDEEGDSYRCNTFSKSDHFVRYNSKKPTIAYISGS